MNNPDIRKAVLSAFTADIIVMTLLLLSLISNGMMIYHQALAADVPRTISAAVINTANATSPVNEKIGSVNATTITIGNPFYSEHDKTTSSKHIVSNVTHGTELTLSGNGTATGVSFTDSGSAIITLGPNKTSVHIQGQVEIITKSGERGNLTFQEIGKIGADGKISAIGAAFFKTSSTGKLAFLNDVSIFRFTSFAIKSSSTSLH